MKKTLIILSLFTASLHAQTLNTKMGKPTDEEMNMTTYEPDPEADAVVLYNNTEVKFDFSNSTGDFRLNYYYKTRIKVLTQQGVDAGNITIDYYDPEETSAREELISDLKVSTYNLENGKVVRSKMSSDLENKERIDKYNCQVKCAAPNVKVGSIIEYEYTLYSDYYFSPNTWFAQSEYPTFYTHYSITVPDWFTFRCYPSGLWPLTYKQDLDNCSILVETSLLNTAAKKHDFVGEKLPAIKDDDYVYCLKDFCAHVEHELKSIQIPGSIYREFNKSWGDLCYSLVQSKSFGSRFKMENPLAEQQKAIDLSGLSLEKRVERLLELLKSQYKWNGNYGLWGASTRKVRNDKDGELNMGSLDFVFMSMLRDAHINAYPTIFSRRSRGRLPYYPSERYFNGMVLYVETSDSTGIYVDPTAEGYPLGTIPPDMMANQAFIIMPERYRTVNLSRIAEGRIMSMTTATISPDGKLEGNATISYRDEAAGSFRASFRAAKDSVEFAQHRISSDEMEITDYQLDRIRENTPQAIEKFHFTQPLEVAGDHIYFNPFTILQNENPFVDEDRNLPVEWPYASTDRHTISITLPDGYVIEEMPQSKIYGFNDNNSLRLNIKAKENVLSISVTKVRQDLLVTPENYKELRSYESEIQNLFSGMVVLKKGE